MQKMKKLGLFEPRKPGTRVSFVVLLVVLSGIAVPAAGQDRVIHFALIGDTPYNAKQNKEFANLIKAINRDDLAFVAHAGDLWFDGIAWKDTSRGLPPCADETMANRLQEINKFRHPFIYTPGDNDWTDCWRAKPKAYDPLERLAKLRKMYFKGNHSLGKRRIKLERQSKNPKYAKFRENARWIDDGAMFVTLHMVGSNNNLGRTPVMDREYKERNAANLAWMDDSFALAKRKRIRAIMFITQADPQFQTTWTAKQKKRYLLDGLRIKPTNEPIWTGFDDFIESLRAHTIEFGKPVVLVHGDTHTFRIDKPLLDTKSGRIIENFTRVEVFGFPDTHWVRATLDPDDPNVFSFESRIISANRASH
ncbi:MAG: hypothetical protein R3188_02140 [Acidiferrobacterales bacterium]|nr:hypothetical protein [Acidiferrobacterales bacterium]